VPDQSMISDTAAPAAGSSTSPRARPARGWSVIRVVIVVRDDLTAGCALPRLYRLRPIACGDLHQKPTPSRHPDTIMYRILFLGRKLDLLIRCLFCALRYRSTPSGVRGVVVNTPGCAVRADWGMGPTPNCAISRCESISPGRLGVADPDGASEECVSTRAPVNISTWNETTALPFHYDGTISQRYSAGTMRTPRSADQRMA
jgi:hypothetical protein